MLAREPLAFNVPNGVIGLIVGLAFGFLIGLFYYQTYRRHYYWWYSLLAGVSTVAVAPPIMHYLLRMDPNTLHALVFQFGLSLVATIATNHLLYTLNKRQRTKHRSGHRSSSGSHARHSHSSRPQTTNLQSGLPTSGFARQGFASELNLGAAHRTSITKRI